MGPNYAPELQPIDSEGTSLAVFINVSILAIPAIDTVKLKYSTQLTSISTYAGMTSG